MGNTSYVINLIKAGLILVKYGGDKEQQLIIVSW